MECQVVNVKRHLASKKCNYFYQAKAKCVNFYDSEVPMLQEFWVANSEGVGIPIV